MTPQPATTPGRRSPFSSPQWSGRSLPFELAEDRVSQFVMTGLMILTLPAVAYSLIQTWNLAGGDTLRQAVRAFLP